MVDGSEIVIIMIVGFIAVGDCGGKVGSFGKSLAREESWSKMTLLDAQKMH